VNVLAGRVLKSAIAELGQHESPAGSNRTKYGKWYGMDGNQWCAMFVSWCFHEAGCTAAIAGLQSGKGFAGTQAALAYAKKHGWLAKTPEPGDIMIHTTVPGKTGHTGIVVRAIAGGVETIEGNTDSAGGRTGGQVMRKTRKASYAAGYIRPRWDAVLVVAPKPIVPANIAITSSVGAKAAPQNAGRIMRDPVTGRVYEIHALAARHIPTVAEAEALLKASDARQLDMSPQLVAVLYES